MSITITFQKFKLNKHFNNEKQEQKANNEDTISFDVRQEYN